MRQKTYHQEKTHGVIEFGSITACLAESLTNLEPTGGQDDSEGDPETTVGGESSSTKSVTDSHFPILKKKHVLAAEQDRGSYGSTEKLGLTYHMPASS